MKAPCDIYKVARQCGVVLRDSAEHSPTSRRPRECYCKPTVREIGQRRGEDHLRLVFRLLTGTERNATALYADSLRAVSMLLSRHRELESRRNLIEAFDRLDMPSLRRWAKVINAPGGRLGALYTVLALKLDLPAQTDLFSFSEAA